MESATRDRSEEVDVGGRAAVAAGSAVAPGAIGVWFVSPLRRRFRGDPPRRAPSRTVAGATGRRS